MRVQAGDGAPKAARRVVVRPGHTRARAHTHTRAAPRCLSARRATSPWIGSLLDCLPRAASQSHTHGTHGPTEVRHVAMAGAAAVVMGVVVAAAAVAVVLLAARALVVAVVVQTAVVAVKWLRVLGALVVPVRVRPPLVCPARRLV